MIDAYRREREARGGPPGRSYSDFTLVQAAANLCLMLSEPEAQRLLAAQRGSLLVSGFGMLRRPGLAGGAQSRPGREGEARADPPAGRAEAPDKFEGGRSGPRKGPRLPSHAWRWNLW